jgi:hypothetical protein
VQVAAIEAADKPLLLVGGQLKLTMAEQHALAARCRALSTQASVPPPVSCAKCGRRMRPSFRAMSGLLHRGLGQTQPQALPLGTSVGPTS